MSETDPKILVGQFLGRRAKNPDTSQDPWDPIRDKSPLEIFPNPSIVLSRPAILPKEPPPALSSPAVIPFEPAPALSKPAEIAFEPAPPLSKPAIIPFEPAPPLSVPAVIPFEPAPPLSVPAVILFEPAPPLSAPAIIPFEPAPPLSVPAILPLEPAPPLSVRSILPDMPAPPLSKPAALPSEPAPPVSIRSALPVMPAPASSVPAVIPFTAAPALSKPSTLPVEPAPAVSKRADLPAMPPPVLSKPTVIPFEDPPAGAGSRHVSEDPGLKKGMPNPKMHAPSGHLENKDDILFRLRSTDSKIVSLFKALDSGERYVDFASGPGTQAWNPTLYAKQLARLGTHLGKSGLALFAAEQLGLFLLNRHGKIWNPLTAAPPPLLQNLVPAALDVLTGTPRLMTGYNDSEGGYDINSKPGFYEKNHGPGADDVHLSLAKGKYNEFRVVHYPPFIEAVFGAGSTGVQNLLAGAPIIGGSRVIGARSQDTSLVDDLVKGSDWVPKPIVQAALELRNKYVPGQDDPTNGILYKEHAVAQIADLVEDALADGSKTGHIVKDNFTSLNRYVYRRSAQPGSGDSVGGIAGKLLSAGRAFIGDRVQLNTGEWRPEIGEASSAKAIGVSKLDVAAFPHGIIPAAFNGENENGFVSTRAGQSPSEKISDDEAYVPLSFTDLRPSNGSYRTIYFRPFITSFNESFSPEWSKQSYFGRVDPVATYQSTGRTITLGFKMVAFGPEDLKTIYQKLGWLSSLVYPEYDKDLLYLSGPVARMRIGDVINAVGPEGCRGLPGIIESLDFDYTEALWELKSGFKVPRNINVSLTFSVLHDRPIGRGEAGKFGGLGTIQDGKFVSPGKSSSPGAGADDGVQFPTVVKGMDSFRSIGKGDTDSMNDYDQLGTADGPKRFNT